MISGGGASVSTDFAPIPCDLSASARAGGGEPDACASGSPPPLYWLRVCETLLVRLGPLRMEGVEVG